METSIGNGPRPRIVVVIPTYQEASTIMATLSAVRAIGCVNEIVVVDDASPDGTGNLVERAAVVDERIILLRRAERLGYGSASLDGIREALLQGADFVVQMDADGAYSANDIWALLEGVPDSDSADRPVVVLGSRWAPGARREYWEPAPALINWVANAVTRRRWRLTYRDCTTGFRVLNRLAAELVVEQEDWPRDFRFACAVLVVLTRADAVVTEVPVRFRARTSA